MKVVSVTRQIAAPPAQVWAVLTSASALVAEKSGITRIDGEIAQGARFKLWSEAAPGRAFAIRVTAFDPPNRMIWDSGMPFRLFHGRREFLLSPEGDGTRLDMAETFTGPLLPLIWRGMPDLTPSFETFAQAVARRAERETT